MDRIQESLNRHVASAPPRRAARPAPRTADGCLSEKQRHTLATVLTCWHGGAQLAVAVAETANRADPNTVSGALLKKVNREVNELLNELEDFQPLVAASVKYAAHLARYELAEQRFMNAIDDQLFECETKLALLGG